MEAVAKLKGAHMSARKMRLAIDLIRGQKVEDALYRLRYTKREASIWVEKVLVSAIANWEQKSGESADSFDLIVKEAFADAATMIKRFRPAPHGRALRIRKRTSHITLVVANRLPLADEELIEADDQVELIEEENN